MIYAIYPPISSEICSNCFDCQQFSVVSSSLMSWWGWLSKNCWMRVMMFVKTDNEMQLSWHGANFYAMVSSRTHCQVMWTNLVPQSVTTLRTCVNVHLTYPQMCVAVFHLWTCKYQSPFASEASWRPFWVVLLLGSVSFKFISHFPALKHNQIVLMHNFLFYALEKLLFFFYSDKYSPSWICFWIYKLLGTVVKLLLWRYTLCVTYTRWNNR